jgi:hypothetical protein
MINLLNIRFIYGLMLFTMLLLTSPASKAEFSGAQANLATDQLANFISVEAKQIDYRAQILYKYLAAKNSPLQYHAQDFIDAADTYGIDWKLVPSIAGVESTYGQHIPGGHQPEFTTYNAWGWGVYGNQAHGFKSWRDGIFTVSQGLKTRYIDRGLTNPYAMNKVYASSPTWGAKVTNLLSDLTVFSQKEQKNFKSKTKIKIDSQENIAGASAKIASR